VSARSYRVAPRPRGSAGPATRVDWERAGRIILVIVFCLVLAWYIRPVLNLADAWRDSKAEGTQLAELKQENAELKARAATLASPAAAERGARRIGMVADGEQPYVIRGLN
jgi:cell division protein FtsB